ncbi:uncharacterized protein LOC116935570 [Daphnia magna]|uniref:uncharacterized protein LOC116935570 n=1 Tax=Daphnia magna TaxID=35525 RepID=UPI001E1BA5A4|nr:uncharacterized protein LOC116935570 [Daphnia magna]
MNNIEQEIPLQQQTNIILDPNNNEEDSTSHTHESEDESDVTNLQNNELTKYPTTQPFTIPLRIKQHLEKKVNEIVSEDWTIDTIKNSKYTIYKFTSELMSSIFTNEYLKTHKRSGKGGKPGKVQREIMNPTYVEKLTSNNIKLINV